MQVNSKKMTPEGGLMTTNFRIRTLNSNSLTRRFSTLSWPTNPLSWENNKRKTQLRKKPRYFHDQEEPLITVLLWTNFNIIHPNISKTNQWLCSLYHTRTSKEPSNAVSSNFLEQSRPFITKSPANINSDRLRRRCPTPPWSWAVLGEGKQKMIHGHSNSYILLFSVFKTGSGS